MLMWGENSSGQCGVPEPSAVAIPTRVELMMAVLELACGGQHTLALSAQREVWSWGSGLSSPPGPSTISKGPGCDPIHLRSGFNSPETGPGPSFPAWRPQRVKALASRCVLQVACGYAHCLALVQDLPTRPLMDRCRRCGQLLYTMTDKEDHVIISDTHCCPFGVEPAEGEEPHLSNPPQLPAPPLAAHSPSPQQPPAMAPGLTSSQASFLRRRSHYHDSNLTDDTALAEQQQAAALARRLHGLLVKPHPPQVRD